MRRGVKLRDLNGDGLEIKQVLYADDTVLVAKTRASPVYCEFERACGSMAKN